MRTTKAAAVTLSGHDNLLLVHECVYCRPKYNQRPLELIVEVVLVFYCSNRHHCQLTKKLKKKTNPNTKPNSSSLSKQVGKI